MFWSKLIGSGDDWDITPTQNIYQNLVGFGINLDLIRNYKNETILDLMIEITLKVYLFLLQAKKERNLR